MLIEQETAEKRVRPGVSHLCFQTSLRSSHPFTNFFTIPMLNKMQKIEQSCWSDTTDPASCTKLWRYKDRQCSYVPEIEQFAHDIMAPFLHTQDTVYTVIFKKQNLHIRDYPISAISMSVDSPQFIIIYAHICDIDLHLC